MPVELRSLGETFAHHVDIKGMMVTGKGGVGKTTVSAAIAFALSRKGQDVVIADADGSPSVLDAFGGTAQQREQVRCRNAVMTIAERVRVIVLSTLVPPIDGAYLDDYAAFHDEMMRLTGRLLPDTLQSSLTFLPLVRLPMQSHLWGFPVDHKDLAHLIQLAEIAGNKRHVVSNFTPGQETVNFESLGNFDTLILDTENTNNYLRLLRTLYRLEKLLTKAHQEMMSWNPLVAVKFMARRFWNLKLYLESSIGKDPSNFTEAASVVRERLIGSRAGIIAVTNPGLAETNKLLHELAEMHRMGRSADHVLMNRFPTADGNARENAIHLENYLLDKLRQTDRDMGYSRVEPSVSIETVSPSDPDCARKQLQNLERVAATFELE